MSSVKFDSRSYLITSISCLSNCGNHTKYNTAELLHRKTINTRETKYKSVETKKKRTIQGNTIQEKEITELTTKKTDLFDTL